MGSQLGSSRARFPPPPHTLHRGPRGRHLSLTTIIPFQRVLEAFSLGRTPFCVVAAGLNSYLRVSWNYRKALYDGQGTQKQEGDPEVNGKEDRGQGVQREVLHPAKPAPNPACGLHNARSQ